MAAVARMGAAAAAMVFALMRPFVRARPLAPVSVVTRAPAAAAALVPVFFRHQVGGGGPVALPVALSLPLPVAWLAPGPRAFPFVRMARVELQVVRALFGFEVRQQRGRGGVVGVSSRRRAAAVRSAARARAVGSRAAPSAVVAEAEEQTKMSQKMKDLDMKL